MVTAVVSESLLESVPLRLQEPSGGSSSRASRVVVVVLTGVCHTLVLGAWLVGEARWLSKSTRRVVVVLGREGGASNLLSGESETSWDSSTAGDGETRWEEWVVVSSSGNLIVRDRSWSRARQVVGQSRQGKRSELHCQNE